LLQNELIYGLHCSVISNLLWPSISVICGTVSAIFYFAVDTKSPQLNRFTIILYFPANVNK